MNTTSLLSFPIDLICGRGRGDAPVRADQSVALLIPMGVRALSAKSFLPPK